MARLTEIHRQQSIAVSGTPRSRSCSTQGPQHLLCYPDPSCSTRFAAVPVPRLRPRQFRYRPRGHQVSMPCPSPLWMPALYSGEKNRAMPVVTKTYLCLLAPHRRVTFNAYVPTIESSFTPAGATVVYRAHAPPLDRHLSFSQLSCARCDEL
jgi:hypothetical protein